MGQVSPAVSGSQSVTWSLFLPLSVCPLAYAVCCLCLWLSVCVIVSASSSLFVCLLACVVRCLCGCLSVCVIVSASSSLSLSHALSLSLSVPHKLSYTLSLSRKLAHSCCLCLLSWYLVHPCCVTGLLLQEYRVVWRGPCNDHSPR